MGNPTTVDNLVIYYLLFIFTFWNRLRFDPRPLLYRWRSFLVYLPPSFLPLRGDISRFKKVRATWCSFYFWTGELSLRFPCRKFRMRALPCSTPRISCSRGRILNCNNSHNLVGLQIIKDFHPVAALSASLLSSIVHSKFCCSSLSQQAQIQCKIQSKIRISYYNTICRYSSSRYAQTRSY